MEIMNVITFLWQLKYIQMCKLGYLCGRQTNVGIGNKNIYIKCAAFVRLVTMNVITVMYTI